MLLIRTFVKQSHIAGIGLYADENIQKGTMVWVFKDNFDRKFSKADIALWPLIAQEQIKTYAYLSKKTGLYIYPIDNGRFMNHSDNPNIDVIFNQDSNEDINIANRDIRKGEEITIDYEKFDREFSEYKHTYNFV